MTEQEARLKAALTAIREALKPLTSSEQLAMVSEAVFIVASETAITRSDTAAMADLSYIMLLRSIVRLIGSDHGVRMPTKIMEQFVRETFGGGVN